MGNDSTHHIPYRRRVAEMQRGAFWPACVGAATIVVAAYFWVSVVTGTPVDVWVAALFTMPASWFVLRQLMQAVQAVRLAQLERILCDTVAASLAKSGIRNLDAKSRALQVDFAFEYDSQQHLLICAPGAGDRARYARRLKSAVKAVRKTAPCTGWLVVDSVSTGDPAGRSVTADELARTFDTSRGRPQETRSKVTQ